MLGVQLRRATADGNIALMQRCGGVPSTAASSLIRPIAATPLIHPTQHSLAPPFVFSCHTSEVFLQSLLLLGYLGNLPPFEFAQGSIFVWCSGSIFFCSAQECVKYGWVLGEWAPCDRTCGGGQVLERWTSKLCCNMYGIDHNNCSRWWQMVKKVTCMGSDGQKYPDYLCQVRHFSFGSAITKMQRMARRRLLPQDSRSEACFLGRRLSAVGSVATTSAALGDQNQFRLFAVGLYLRLTIQQWILPRHSTLSAGPCFPTYSMSKIQVFSFHIIQLVVSDRLWEIFVV